MHSFSHPSMQMAASTGSQAGFWTVQAVTSTQVPSMSMIMKSAGGFWFLAIAMLREQTSALLRGKYPQQLQILQCAVKSCTEKVQTLDLV
eukprot:jgi/Chrzof1/5374/Cz16g00150.t1